MMELMPHRRNRGRGGALGLGALNTGTRGGYAAGGRPYTVVDMHPMASDTEPGGTEHGELPSPISWVPAPYNIHTSYTLL